MAPRLFSWLSEIVVLCGGLSIAHQQQEASRLRRDREAGLIVEFRTLRIMRVDDQIAISCHTARPAR